MQLFLLLLPPHLQVAVAPAWAAAPPAQVAAGQAVKEVAVVVAAAVLLQDVPHLGLEEGHVHVDGHHLQEERGHSQVSQIFCQGCFILMSAKQKCEKIN